MANNFTSMDHNDIMDSLALYLKGQDEFKDFNFDGSAIRQFLRILAYNTQQQSYQNNFVFNELQHDSAQLRQNLTSLASRLGYTAASKRAARLTVNIVVKPNSIETADASIVLDRNTTFYATKDSTAFIFSPQSEYSATLINGEYRFNNVVLLQGVWALNSYIVQTTDGIESYILPNDKIDTNTLEVYVRDSDSSGTQVEYKRFTTAYDLGEDSKVFFLRENRTGFFEFKFGDNSFSKKLDYGNIITTRYLVTEGDTGNNIGSLSPASSISGYYNIQINKVDEFSYGGSEEEGMESIRTMSTLGFTASDNAVTAGDYVSIVRKIFPEAGDVISWGGEENDPPRYGYAFIAIKPKNSEVLSDGVKLSLINELQKYNIGSISPLIADPNYTYINVDSIVRYVPKQLSITTNSARAKIIDGLALYSNETLELFGGRLDMSKLSEYINTIDKSISGNFTRVTYEKHFVPALNSSGTYEIKFYHTIKEGSVEITGFKISDINSDLTSYSILDNGLGVLRLLATSTGVTRVVSNNIGTVDYSTGRVAITGFRPNALTEEFVRVKVKPSEDYAIDTSISAFNNIVLKINDINVTLVSGNV